MTNLARRVARTILAVVIGYAVTTVLHPINSAMATSNPLTQLITPAGTLTVTSTPTNLPRPAGWTGKTCTVILWNPTATPVYFGGPTAINGSPTVGTVNVAGGIPICSDATQCIVGPVTLDVTTIALVSAVPAVAGIRYAFGGGC